MRTPNCFCLVCGLPLYRRPADLARVRHVACMEHRAQAQAISGVTPAQAAALNLGRVPGTNHRKGYKHSAQSRAKTSASHKKWCAENPDRVAARGAKNRAEAHYRWKGGSSQLSQSIRRLNEYRKWAKAVRARDGACVRCGGLDKLEAHHRIPFSDLLALYGVTTREEARECQALWMIINGETLCRAHHYETHGRKHAD